MKRFILAICLIAVAVVISIISLVAIEKTNEKMFAEIDNILKYTNEDNYTALNQAVKEITEQWEKEKPLLNILIGQKETNEITDNLRMIEFFAKEGNKESLLLYIYECKTTMERIKTTNEPSFSTIL